MRSLIIVSLLLGLFFTFPSAAQQLPIFTQYREYHSYINPATISHDYMTYEYNVNVGISYRSQWSGFQEAPASLFAKAEYLIHTGNSFNLEVGGYLLNYDTNPIKTTGVFAKVAALFTGDPYYGALSVGLTGGLQQYTVSGDELRPFHVNDIVLSRAIRTQSIPDIGFGVFLYKQIDAGFLRGDSYYAGISIPQILALDVTFRGDAGDFSYKQERHFFGQVGLYKYFNELSFIQPSLWIKYVDNAPVHFDINARYSHNDDFFAGLGWSSANSLHFEAGVYINPAQYSDKRKLKIGYGFGYSLQELAAELGSTHEINLAFLLDTRAY